MVAPVVQVVAQVILQVQVELEAKDLQEVAEVLEHPPILLVVEAEQDL
jgi:hypothetical protein